MSENINCYAKYSPDQARDERGRFGEGSASSVSSRAYSSSDRAVAKRERAITTGRAEDHLVAAMGFDAAAQHHDEAAQAINNEAVQRGAALGRADSERIRQHQVHAANMRRMRDFHSSRAGGGALPTHNLPTAHARTNSF